MNKTKLGKKPRPLFVVLGIGDVEGADADSVSVFDNHGDAREYGHILCESGYKDYKLVRRHVGE